MFGCGQTYRQMDKRRDRQTDKRTKIQMDVDLLTDRWKDKHIFLFTK